MKVAAIFLVSCVLFTLLPIHFSQEMEATVGKLEPVWCPSEQVFNGGCTDKGSPSYTCLLDFLASRSASAMPKNCNCTPKPNDKRLCECQVVCNN